MSANFFFNLRIFLTSRKGVRSMKTNVKPLADKVLIRPIQEDETTKSGIVLPDTAEKEKPEKGEVVAVGSGKILENGKIQKPEVKKGDKVLFTKYSPSEIKVDGEELLILSESDILAVIK